MTDLPPPPSPPTAATTPYNAAPGPVVAPPPKGRGGLIAGLVALIVVLLAGGLGVGYLVFHKADPAVATLPTARPTTAASATGASTPTPSAAPQTPSGPTTADLTAIATAMFPQSSAGRGTCFQGDVTFASCPVTERLRTALKAHVSTGTGGGGDPVCGCQNFDSAATFTYRTGGNDGSGAILISGFGGQYRLDVIVVHQGSSFLADDIQYCSSNPPGSVYPGESVTC